MKVFPHPLLSCGRFDENQVNVTEMEEFLPHGAEKKQTHFTDVSFGILFWVDGCNFNIFIDN